MVTYRDTSAHARKTNRLERNRSRLDPDHYMAAAVAKAVYKDEDGRRNFNHLTNKGYEYCGHCLSDRETGVWHKDNHYFIGLKGTAPTSASDWYHDISIATGTELSDSHFKKVTENVKNFVRSESRKNPNAKFSVSGHSLGGRLVNAFVSDPHAMNRMENAYTFAPGAGPIVNTESSEKIKANSEFGWDYTHLHQHLTGPADILSSNASHNEPGKVYHHHTQSHIDWDKWLSEGYWDNYDVSQAPLDMFDFFLYSAPLLTYNVAKEAGRAAIGYEKQPEGPQEIEP